jgi:dehydrogenase/reductase SDR family protein 7B
MKQNFKNKVVWITGASSGIGEALAIALAKEGARLVLTARNEEKLTMLKEKCQNFCEHCLVLPMDLFQIASIPVAVEQVIAEFGRIDMLINNAGISQRALTREADLSIDRKVMELNFFSPVAMTKAVLPQMIQQKSGHIVAVSSIVGKFGFPLRSAYSSSKHALFGFFDSLRAEEDDLDVTIIIPGRIQSNISLNAIGKDGKADGKMDAGQANGMPADKCAAIIVKGLKNKKKE